MGRRSQVAMESRWQLSQFHRESGGRTGLQRSPIWGQEDRPSELGSGPVIGCHCHFARVWPWTGLPYTEASSKEDDS